MVNKRFRKASALIILLIFLVTSLSFAAEAKTSKYDTDRYYRYYDDYYSSRYSYGSRNSYDRGYVAGYVDGYHDGYDNRRDARYTYKSYESNRKIYVKYYPVYRTSYKVYSYNGYRYY